VDDVMDVRNLFRSNKPKAITQSTFILNLKPFRQAAAREKKYTAKSGE